MFGQIGNRRTRMSEVKATDYRFKILYAVGIIVLVCDHAQGGGISLANDWFPYGGVHLALFVFCSGYFYKRSSEENVKKYIFKKIKTLLLPLYIYTVLYGVLVQLLKLKGFEIGGKFTVHNLFIAPITNGHQFIYNMGGWFIVPLFMIEICNILCRKLLKTFNSNISEAVFFVIGIAGGLVGNQLACAGYISGWWLVLVRMIYFLPFYNLGTFYKSHLEKLDKRIPSFWLFTAVFFIKLLIAWIYGKMPSYTPSWCHNFTEGPVMPILTEYVGIIFWMRIATILEPVMGRSKWINLIADNTYSIMMNQFLGFMIVKTVYAVFNKLHLAFADFDWVSYKTDIWWYYKPKGLGYTLIIYVVAGIVFSIMVQKAVDAIIYQMKIRFWEEA